MNLSYLEMMRAHVDEGGQLSHRNGLDLLAAIEKLQSTRCKNCGDPIAEMFCGMCREMGCAPAAEEKLALSPPVAERGGGE